MIRPRRTSRRAGTATLTAAAALVLAALAIAPCAQAAFPGANGKIAFWGIGAIPGGEFDAVFTVNSDGSNSRFLTAGGEAPAFSPSGKQIAYGYPGGQIEVMSADGSHIEQVTPFSNGFFDRDPAFSPTGQQIAFTRVLHRPLNAEIYKVNSDGSDPTRLTNSLANEGYPEFSPTAPKIAYVRQPAPGSPYKSDIWIMAADGTNQVQLTKGPATDCCPSFSPDGTKIAFARTTSSNAGGIYVMDLDGSYVRRLTAGGATDPAFSPNGRKIVFARRDEFFTMNANGTRQQALPGPVGGIGPDWGVRP